MKRTFGKLNEMATLFVIILLGTMQSLNAASPGSLDSSFGVAGKVVSNIFVQDILRDVAVQDDGKIVVTVSNTAAIFNTVRFTANGIFDTTFGNDGIVQTSLGGQSTSTRIAIQTDEKIVIIGSQNSNCGIIRYNPNGSLDTSFDSDGKLIIPFPTIQCRDIAIQNDGKIVLAGDLVGSQQGKLVRLNTDGSFDSTFGTSGVVTTSNAAFTNRVKIASNGKIVVAGSNLDSSLLLRRYNPDGSLDSTFGISGRVDINSRTSGVETFLDMAIDLTDNTITAVGRAGNDFVVYRFMNNGFADTSFNTNGRLEARIQNGFSSIATDVIIQSDRKIVLGCNNSPINNGQAGELIMIRLERNGAFDNSFGKDGFAFTGVQQSFSFTNRTKLVGNKLIAGFSVNGINDSDFGLMRLNLSVTPSQSGDFDGDGFGDITVYRPSQGLWIILNSSDSSVVFKQFGLNGDIPIDGDFDGDGKNDYAIYRPSNGLWFVEKSSDGTNFARQFGTGSDKPVTDDYDKDGKADIAFFRPSSGEWFVLRSSDGFNTFFAFPFGQNGDIPIVKKGP